MTTSIETTDITTATSPLDGPPARFADTPFFDETVTLLRGWQESRWHASVISSDIPAELRKEGSA